MKVEPVTHTRRLLGILMVLLVTIAPAAAGCSRSAVVPDVSGMSADEAAARLERAGLVSVAGKDPSGSASVDSTEPAEGEEVEHGSQVRLVMAVEIPDLIGRPLDEAAGLLVSLGLQVTELEEHSEDVARGLISRTEPPAGSLCSPGTPVSLFASKGSAYVTCPVCGGQGYVYVKTGCEGFDCFHRVKETCGNCMGEGRVPRGDE